MIGLIVAAEIAFWVLLLGGLAMRYLLRRERTSARLLRLIPAVDLLLCVAVAVDVAAGAAPERSHALAAVYLGVTVAFGSTTVSWADARFRHRFDGGPAPVKPARGSAAAVRALWVEWGRVVLAGAISCVLILGLIALTHDPVPPSTDALSTDPYWGTMALIGVVTVIWFLAGPAFETRRREPTS